MPKRKIKTVTLLSPHDGTPWLQAEIDENRVATHDVPYHLRIGYPDEVNGHEAEVRIGEDGQRFELADCVVGFAETDT